jgi:hypothetical protein
MTLSNVRSRFLRYGPGKNAVPPEMTEGEIVAQVY